MFFPIALSLVTTAGHAAPTIPQAPPFAAPTVLDTTWVVSNDVATGDLNGDGVPDMVHANPGLALGANLVTFRARLLDDDARGLEHCVGGMPMGPTGLSCTIRAAVGDFDEDGRDDVVTLTYTLTLNLALNVGQSRTVAGFPRNTIVADLNAHFGYIWPAVLRVPVFLVADCDADGHLDIVLAPTLVEYFAQHMSTPGMFTWFGRGDGTFEPVVRTPLPSTPVDADWIDRDGDGTAETLAFLGQVVPNPFSTTTDITCYSVANRTFVQSTPTQTITEPDYATSFTWVPRPGGPAGAGTFVVTGHHYPSTYEMKATLVTVPMDPLGLLAPEHVVTLPPWLANDVDCDLVCVQAGDFDADGAEDVVVLVGLGGARPGKLLWALGPFDPSGPRGGLASSGLGTAYVRTENSPMSSGPGMAVVWTPNLTSPASIATVDFDLDQNPDLLVSGLVVPAQSMRMATAAIHNLAQPLAAVAAGHVRRVGPGRPSPAGVASRCGVGGGLPVTGNADFAVTFGNGPRDALVSLVAGTPTWSYSWGPLPLASTPDFFSALRWLHGPVDGSTSTRIGVPIPQDPVLHGYDARFQWLVFDPNSTASFPIYSSETIEVRVGQRR